MRVLAVPPLQERNSPEAAYHDTVICALTPDLAFTSEANLHLWPALTLMAGSLIRVVDAVDVTRAAQEAAT